jgi:hypothetical protein
MKGTPAKWTRPSFGVGVKMDYSQFKFMKTVPKFRAKKRRLFCAIETDFHFST